MVKRKRNTTMTVMEHLDIINACDEDKPEGLQCKFYHLACLSLNWSVEEAAYCSIHYFKEEITKEGQPTGRLEYNTFFAEKDKSKNAENSKWLTRNVDEKICPVRLFKKLLNARPDTKKTDKLFLAINTCWKSNTRTWFKVISIEVEVISGWSQRSAKYVKTDVPSICLDSTDDEIDTETKSPERVYCQSIEQEDYFLTDTLDEPLIDSDEEVDTKFSERLDLQYLDEDCSDLITEYKVDTTISEQVFYEYVGNNEHKLSTYSYDTSDTKPRLLTEHDCDDHNETGCNLEELQLNNKRLKYKLILEQQEEEMKLYKIQFKNEMLKSKLLKVKLIKSLTDVIHDYSQRI